MEPTIKLDKLNLVTKLSKHDRKDILGLFRFKDSNEYYSHIHFIGDSSNSAIYLNPVSPFLHQHYNCMISFNPAKLTSLPSEILYVLQKSTSWKIKRMDVALDFEIAISNTFLKPYKNMKISIRKDNYNRYQGVEKSFAHAILYDKARERRDKGTSITQKFLTRLEIRFEPALKDNRFITCSDFSWTEEQFRKFIFIPDIRPLPVKVRELIKSINYKKRSYSKLTRKEKSLIKEAAETHGVNYYELFAAQIINLLSFLPEDFNEIRRQQLIQAS